MITIFYVSVSINLRVRVLSSTHIQQQDTPSNNPIVRKTFNIGPIVDTHILQ